MRTSKRQRGVAAVEFALMLTFILIPIVFAITEFGRALFVYNTIVKATRDAARYYSIQTPSVTPTATTDGQTAQCLAVTGVQTNSCSSLTPLAPGLTTAMVQICDRLSCPGTHAAQGTAPVVDLVTVTVIGYAFTSLVPFVVPSVIFGDPKLGLGISTTMKGNT